MAGIIAGLSTASSVLLIFFWLVASSNTDRGDMINCIYQGHEIKACEQILDFTWTVRGE